MMTKKLANDTRRAGMIVLLALLTLAVGVSESGAAQKDIVETAKSAGQFKTLLAAVEEAGLVRTLKGEGPFTLFAPSDAAFEKLPAGTVESLLKPQARKKLVTILTYHVVPGRLLAADVTERPSARTVLGPAVSFSQRNGDVLVSGAKVLKADIMASNGVIHVIDSVLIPPDVVDQLAADGRFKTLITAAKAAGLVDALRQDGPITLLAPTDEAFQKLSKATLESLLKPENKRALKDILTYHVLPQRLLLAERSAKTLQGTTVTARAEGTVLINNAEVLEPDVLVANGVIHVIDTVLVPEPKPLSRNMAARRLIELAIDRGVPLFNNGQPEACAAIYEVAAESLLAAFSDVFSQSAVKRLRSALQEASRMRHNSGARAWTLRRALDTAYADLREKEPGNK